MKTRKSHKQTSKTGMNLRSSYCCDLVSTENGYVVCDSILGFPMGERDTRLNQGQEGPA